MDNNIKNRKPGKIILLVLSIFLVFSFLISPSVVFALDEDADPGSEYDYVLVIDESGSMKVNDPQDLRKDAAKLFIYLAETMNRGNRALISGFGEKTNIYTDLIEISSNEDDISSAIDEIKSDQDLTDMKGVLENIKQVLDGRAEKKKTVVIFLTDGSLTIDDIPIETDTGQKPSGDKPERTPGRGEGEQDIPESPEIFDEEAKGEIERSDPIRTPGDYLEEYKRELISLCYAYQNDGIMIHPIAFTKESEVEILEQISGITGGVCWKAEEASDLRTAFIGILENITRRFIRIEEQEKAADLKGEFTVSGYIDELIVLALRNNYQTNPRMNLTPPGNASAEYDDYIEESIFKIGRIMLPQKGMWKYEISGDAVFVYDILDSVTKEPRFSAYTTNPDIPLMIDISEIVDLGYEVDLKDFEINAAVLDPEGMLTEDISVNDLGTGSDKQSSDGIFSGIYNNPGLSGYYNVSFNIKHLPTDSVSNRNINFRVYSVPVEITMVEPDGGFYELGSKLSIVVNLEKKPEEDREFDPDDFEVRCVIEDEHGVIREDVLLSDNGQGADKKAGDGVYASIFENTLKEGVYTITCFIRDKQRMDTPAYTGLEAYFELGEIIEEVTAATTGSEAVEETSDVSEPAEEKAPEPISTTMLVIIIASGFAAIMIIGLLIYYLIIRPRKKK